MRANGRPFLCAMVEETSTPCRIVEAKTCCGSTPLDRGVVALGEGHVMPVLGYTSTYDVMSRATLVFETLHSAGTFYRLMSTFRST